MPNSGVVASILGALTAAQVPMTDDVARILVVLAGSVGPVLAMIAAQAFRARAARRAAEAQGRRERAAAIKADGNPLNDGDAAAELRAADAAQAEADALEDGAAMLGLLRGRHPPNRPGS